MKLLVKEYRDVLVPEDVTSFGVLPNRVHEVDEDDTVIREPEFSFMLRAMFKYAKRYGHDWVQFYNQDRKILYHAVVVKDKDGTN